MSGNRAGQRCKQKEFRDEALFVHREGRGQQRKESCLQICDLVRGRELLFRVSGANVKAYN